MWRCRSTQSARTGPVLGVIAATTGASADPGSAWRPLLELGGSVSLQGPGSLGLSELPGPPAYVDYGSDFFANSGVRPEAAIALGLGFDPPGIVTRLRYARGSIKLAPADFVFPSLGPLAMDDFRIETTWRPGTGSWRPYVGIAAGYRHIQTFASTYFMGGSPTIAFSLTPPRRRDRRGRGRPLVGPRRSGPAPFRAAGIVARRYRAARPGRGVPHGRYPLSAALVRAPLRAGLRLRLFGRLEALTQAGERNDSSRAMARIERGVREIARSASLIVPSCSGASITPSAPSPAATVLRGLTAASHH
jgi:hypothetical protein